MRISAESVLALGLAVILSWLVVDGKRILPPKPKPDSEACHACVNDCQMGQMGDMDDEAMEDEFGGYGGCQEECQHVCGDGYRGDPYGGWHDDF